MRGRVTFLPLPMTIRECSGVNPALWGDQKESREKVSLQYKDKEEKKMSSRFSLTFTLSLTHSYSFLHTIPQTCQTKNKTVEHAEKKIMQYGTFSENNVI